MRIKASRFFILIPVIILFGAGIFVRSLRQTAPVSACVTMNYSGMLEQGEDVAFWNGREVDVPNQLLAADYDSESQVLGVAEPNARYIEVDLSEQTLRAWDGDSLFMETLVSTGLPWWPTPTGEFRIWVKLRATRMEGGEGRYYYNLPNVPYVMYFENEDVPGWRGYGLHGAYWHNEFGTERSHGCVNLPIDAAQKLYFWVTPNLPDGKTSVFSSPENIGTKIIIHE